MTHALCSAGLLAWRCDGRLVPTGWLSQQMGPIIFVELKLSRWAEALDQASFYLRRCDLSCVVLDGDAAAEVPRGVFAQAGIGLFAAWPERLEMLVSPKLSNRRDTSHRHFNRLRAIQDLSRKRPRKWMLA